jgi:hypothetical protein
MAQKFSASEQTTIPLNLPMRRIRIGLGLTLIGFVVFLIGIRPDAFGLDRSPVIGFIQIAVFLVGLAGMCIGGYISLVSVWKDHHLSILAEIGQRLVATGYLVAVFAGMADIFGFGSHSLPHLLYFGVLQALGVMAGQFLIALGFLFLIPYGRNQGIPKKP